MEAVGLAASILSLIDLSKTIYNWVHDAIKAGKEREKLLVVLDNLMLVLESLRDREDEARQNPNVPWYQGLIALSRSAKQTSPNNWNVIPDSTGKGGGVLKRLKQAIEKMISLLEIPRGERIRQRILWPYQKVKFEEMLIEIERWQKLVDSILHQDHFKLSLDTNSRVQSVETNINDIHSRTQIIETIAGDTKEIKGRLQALEERGERKDREKERKNIISWLSPLEFRKRQAEIFSAKCTLTGNRLLESAEFQAWVSGRPWSLLCQGTPGAGKTVLSSIVIDHLKNQFKNRNVPVLCLFLNYKEKMIQTLNNLIGSLLKQLIQYQGDQFQSADVKALFQEGYGEAPPDIDELCRAFQSEITVFPRVMIIVDALDEISTELRAQLLYELRNLPENTSLMITSRPFDTEFGSGPRVRCRVCKRQPLKLYFNCEICDGGEFDLCEECNNKGERCKDMSHVLKEPYQEVRMDVDPTEAEINYYVEWALERETKMGSSSLSDQRLSFVNGSTTNLGDRCREDATLGERIKSTIVARADGMFMLAKLYVESLKVKLSVEEVDEALESLPLGYTETYDRAMDRIDAPSFENPSDQSSYLARRILILLVFTFRPLSLLEVQEALAVNLQRGEFKMVHKFPKKTLIDITAGLVTVDSDEKAVRLVHLTAEDYFTKHRERLFPNVSNSASHANYAHANIAQTLLVYLSRRELSEPCQGDDEDEQFDERKRKHALLSYAYQNWGDHARQAGSDPTIQSAILKFMSDHKRIEAAIQASCYLEPTDSAAWDVRKGANSIHICAWFDLADIVPSLVREGLDVDSQDPIYRQTPLIFACKRGNLSAVSALLNLGASVNLVSARKSTALFEAVSANHIDVVRLLLTKKELHVNAAHAENCNRTALMLASQKGYDPLVKVLLTRCDLNINQKDSNQETALTLAAFAQHQLVVQSLLQRSDIEINAVNRTGNSALILAVRCGRDDIVDLLLSKGADLSITDQEGGGTALFWAIRKAKTSMVQTMLKHNINIQDLDEMGRSLLHIAAGEGSADIISLLIDKGLDKNIRDGKERTPLHEASRYNKPEAIKVLLKLGADSSLEDEARRTPWAIAWEYGHISIMRIIDKEDITEQGFTGPYPNEEELPIWSIAKLGRKDLLKDAISKKKKLDIVNPDNGDSPIHCAVSSNHPEILQLLLKSNLSPNPQNIYLRTPLHLAAIYGNLPATTLLLAHNAACNIQDKWFFAPLYYAQHRKHFQVALALIEAGADTKALSSEAIQDLFFAAIESSYSVALKILIDNGADVWKKGIAGQTGLEIAKERGDMEIQRVLKANKSRYVTMTMRMAVKKEDWAKEKMVAGFPQPKNLEEGEDEEDETEMQEEGKEDAPEPNTNNLQLRPQDTPAKAETKVQEKVEGEIFPSLPPSLLTSISPSESTSSKLNKENLLPC